MSALFELTPHGWICRKVWSISNFKKPLIVKELKSIFMNISKAPKHGFCLHPHKYL